MTTEQYLQKLQSIYYNWNNKFVFENKELTLFSYGDYDYCLFKANLLAIFIKRLITPVGLDKDVLLPNLYPEYSNGKLNISDKMTCMNDIENLSKEIRETINIAKFEDKNQYYKLITDLYNMIYKVVPYNILKSSDPNILTKGVVREIYDNYDSLDGKPIYYYGITERLMIKSILGDIING